jgi:hypothetical protein
MDEKGGPGAHLLCCSPLFFLFSQLRDVGMFFLSFVNFHEFLEDFCSNLEIFQMSFMPTVIWLEVLDLQISVD